MILLPFFYFSRFFIKFLFLSVRVIENVRNALAAAEVAATCPAQAVRVAVISSELSQAPDRGFQGLAPGRWAVGKTLVSAAMMRGSSAPWVVFFFSRGFRTGGSIQCSID